ncbi:MAG TPA: CsbD family protein [Ilumatobacter sp.]|nr:CsbD family protein [Ilumatobacter sp.]
MSGEADQVKGRLKQAAGDLADDDDMKREGQRDETAGKVKEKVGDVKDEVDDAIDAVKNKAND